LHQLQLVAWLDDERWWELALVSPRRFIRWRELDYVYAACSCLLHVSDNAPVMVVVDNAGVVGVVIDRRIHPVYGFAGETDEFLMHCLRQ